jgi:hypothetical protein
VGAGFVMPQPMVSKEEKVRMKKRGSQSKTSAKSLKGNQEISLKNARRVVWIDRFLWRFGFFAA